MARMSSKILRLPVPPHKARLAFQEEFCHRMSPCRRTEKFSHNTYDNVQPRLGLTYRINDPDSVHHTAAFLGRFYDNWAAVIGFPDPTSWSHGRMSPILPPVI